MKKKLSIKHAIIAPFLLVMICLLASIGVIWRMDYNWLVDIQGEKIITSISDNSSDRLSYFLSGPANIAEIYANELIVQQFNQYETLEKSEKFTISFYKKLVANYPQISTVGYGDEHGNYLGFRYDDVTKSFNLMLKDSRTKGLLNIYEGETLSTKVIASYEGYDPRVRPWYAPVKETPSPQWSDFYINFDEKKEATISILMPLADPDRGFFGVAVLDVKLEGINEFLRKEQARSGGAIYIMDPKGQVIGHSEPTPVVIEVEGPQPEGQLIRAVESESELIRKSAVLIVNQLPKVSTNYVFDLERGKGTSMARPFEDRYGLKWQVVVALPIDLLMGDVLNHQWISFFIIAGTLLTGLVLGLYAMNRLAHPIASTVQAITRLSEGHWESELSDSKYFLKETSDLVNAFNHMTLQIQSSFENLQKSEEKYRLLVENSDDLIFSLDVKGHFLAVNKAFETVLGIRREQLIGQPFATVIDSNLDWELLERQLAADKEANMNLNQLIALTDVKGSVLTYNMTVIPIFDGNGSLIGYTGTNNDITALLNIENEKIAALGYVVSGISHEINTPIGNCITMSTYLLAELESLKEKIEDNGIRRSDLDRFIQSAHDSSLNIIKNLEHGRELVNAFKALAVNKSAMSRVEINLKQFLEVIFETSARKFNNSKVQFDLICDEALTVTCEQIKITQVFIELIENSFYHGFDGKKEGKIAIRVTGPDVNGMIHIHYKDNGVGLKPGLAKEIFTPFFSTKFGAEHNGLGLNIVYNTVKSGFNGELTLVDRKDNDAMDSNHQGFELKMLLKQIPE